jgi:hypothetical protein
MALSLACFAGTASAALEVPADRAAFKGVGKKLPAEWKGEPGWPVPLAEPDACYQ